MKKLRTFIIILCLISTCFLWKSCSMEDPVYFAFLIKVDSVRIPSEIKANIPFDVEFFGTIGTNGCYYFEEFFQFESDNEIIIEAWGSLDFKAKDCPAVMVYLDGRKKSVTIDKPGTYIIRIKQPRSLDIQKQITVT